MGRAAQRSLERAKQNRRQHQCTAVLYMDSSCLRAPGFLGVHTLALGQELSLDAGVLVMWSGAAAHDDQSTRALGGCGTGLAIGTERPFSSAASGSRKVSGPFVRAVMRGATTNVPRPLHLWLDAADAESSPMASMSDASKVHRLGPYRIRVLSAKVVTPLPGGNDAVGALQPAETLLVRVAVDKVPQDVLPFGELVTHKWKRARREQSFWLSTQGAMQLSLQTVEVVGGSSAVECLVGNTDGNTAVSHKGSLQGTSSLPPLPSLGSLPPLSATVAGVTAANSVTSTLELHLHAVPKHQEVAEGDDAGFGCAVCGWTAELDAMSIGVDEGHLVLPLELASAGDSAQRIRVGDHEIRVLQCTGHYARCAAPGQFESDYPLLLLHVQVSVRQLPDASACVAGGAGNLRELKLAESRRLGAAFERLLDL